MECSIKEIVGYKPFSKIVRYALISKYNFVNIKSVIEKKKVILETNKKKKMNLKYLGEGEVRKIMKSLGMICHIYILNVKQDLQPLPTVVTSMYIDVEKMRKPN